MTFVSFEYLVLLLGTFSVYYLLPWRARIILVLLASYVFYAYWELWYAYLIAFTTLVDYGAALAVAPGDRIALALLARCRALAADPPPPDWTGAVHAVDPATGDTRSVDLGGNALRPAFGMGYVWVCALTTKGGQMMRVDPNTLHAEFAGKGLPEEGGEYVAGLGSLWRLDVSSGTLMRFSPKTREYSRRDGISAAPSRSRWMRNIITT